jgi:hypothetical protein
MRFGMSLAVRALNRLQAGSHGPLHPHAGGVVAVEDFPLAVLELEN